jgi:Leucine-rich repeat (LRR) protein
MNARMLCISMLLSLTLVPTDAATPLTDSSKDRTIAEVERLGGKVKLDETRPDKPIVKIDLHNTQVTDSDLAFLVHGKKDLNELRYLDLRLTKIGDAGVAKIKGLRSLQTLNLFRTQLSDQGLSYIKNLKQLQTLLIGGTKVTDAGLVNLKSMKELKKLSLFQTQVTDAGIPHLKILLKLESLLISGTKITDAGARELRKAQPMNGQSSRTVGAQCL